jgi:hypothetical protein
MRIVVFGVFARSILLIANLAEPETRTLSGRLAALRFASGRPAKNGPSNASLESLQTT